MPRVRSVAAGVVVVVTAVLGSALPASAGPRLSVGPSTNLADGQVVRAAVIGFPPNTSIGLIQCGPGARNQAGCDSRTLVYLTTGPHGMVSSSFIATRNIVTANPRPGTKVDCAVAACTIGVGTFDQATTAVVHVTFDKSAPLAPPLKVGVTVAHTGTVNTTTHVATIGGTLTCNRAALVYVYGEVDQLIPFFGVWAVSRSYINIGPVTCGAPAKSIPLTIKVGDLESAAPGSFVVGFKPGKAKAEGYAQGHAGTSFADAAAEDVTVMLSAAP